MVKTTGPAPFAHFVIYEGNRSKSTVVLLINSQTKKTGKIKLPFWINTPYFSSQFHLI